MYVPSFFADPVRCKVQADNTVRSTAAAELPVFFAVLQL